MGNRRSNPVHGTQSEDYTMAADDAAAAELSNLKLTKIPEVIVQRCKDIHLLDLSENRGIRLNNALRHFKNVTKLLLINCDLREIPDEICELEQLKHLQLSDNKFSSGLNPALFRLPLLVQLELKYCEVRNLPDRIGDLEQLEDLDLSANSFSNGLNSALARLRRLRKLNLSDCTLTSLPDWIGDLEQLEDLTLSKNDFSRGLNSAFARLRRLQKLHLGYCKLTSLPDCIGDLEQLEDLSLCDNDFSRGLDPALARLRRLRKLYLGSCKLTSLPDWIGDLEQLEDLVLRCNDFSGGLNSVFARLRRLRKLDLEYCLLDSLPDWIGDLEQLEELNVRSNYFSDGLNPAVGRLRQLKRLGLNSEQLGVPGWIGVLEQLEVLNLELNAYFGHLNPALGHLRKLRVLDLHYSGLTSLPDSIGDMQQLEVLDLQCNCFGDDLNPTLGRLRLLKQLNLRSCFLTSLPDWIGDLEQLVELNLAENRFSGCLNPALGRLRLLEKLNLSSSGLENLPDSIGDLQRLKILHIGTNRLTDYPLCTLRLKKLQCLDVSIIAQNRYDKPYGIKSLPVELANTNLFTLILDGNAITDPPEEVWSQGIDAIKSFMRAVIRGGELVYADTINMIGETCAGKTSVAQSLIAHSPKPTEEADRTRVLQQHKIKVGDSTGQSVIINDFGGHEIYHSVMPIFLPTNGLLILVYNMLDTSYKEAVKKWMLTAIAKSKEIRLIIVGTHADLITDGTQRSVLEQRMVKFSSKVLHSAIAEVDAHMTHVQSWHEDIGKSDKLKTLAELLVHLTSAVVQVVTLSCSVYDGGLSRLRDVVVKLMRPPSLFPNRWFRVMNDLLNKSLDGLYITMKHVEDICEAHFTDADDCNALTTILRYLALSSQIIWLEDHPVLQKFIFNSPQKIIDTCKKILHHNNCEYKIARFYKEMLEQYEKGVLLEPLLRKLLVTTTEDVIRNGNDAVYESQLFDVVANFLEQCNLIGHMRKESDGKQFIIPCKLTSTEPQRLQKVEEMGQRCLNRVTIRLSFLGSIIPMSLFETSLSSMLNVAGEISKHLDLPEVWKDGAIIIHDGVFFITKRKDAVIILTAFSEPSSPSPWTVLHPILRQLNDNAIASWHGVPPSCTVSCPWCARQNQCNDGTSQVGEIRVSLTTLVAQDDKSNARPTCRTCMKTIPRCLCFPTMEYNGSFTDHRSEIERFFRNADERQPQVKLEVHWAAVSDEQTYEALRQSHYELVSKLSCKEVTAILFQNGILIESDMNLIKNKEVQSSMDARDHLLEVVRKKDKLGFQQFVDALYATKQENLYFKVMDHLRMIAPQAFEATSAVTAQRT